MAMPSTSLKSRWTREELQTLYQLRKSTTYTWDQTCEEFKKRFPKRMRTKDALVRKYRRVEAEGKSKARDERNDRTNVAVAVTPRFSMKGDIWHCSGDAGHDRGKSTSPLLPKQHSPGSARNQTHSPKVAPKLPRRSNIVLTFHRA